MTGYTAVADYWSDGTFTLTILRAGDKHEMWGDGPIPAARPEDMPSAAERRLRSPVAYRVAGPWRRAGDGWTAPVELTG